MAGRPPGTTLAPTAFHQDPAGLEEPPPISSDVPGTRYLLHADGLGGVGRIAACGSICL